MNCVKCRQEIPDECRFCPACGWKQSKDPNKKTKSRGNGQGSVYKTPSGKWCAEVTIGYEMRDGKAKRITRKKSGFKTKREALEYLPFLRQKKTKNKNITFRELYDLWLPAHEATGVSRNTINCYKAAWNYYSSIRFIPVAEIGIDDLQECLDECPKGKRTKQNMKALGTLLYKYALPRGYIPDNINYAQFLRISGDDAGTREAFTSAEIEKIHKAVDRVPYANWIYCLIYLGFRPSEFLSLRVENYDPVECAFVGGGKTEAGRDRTVTVSPKIKQTVLDIIAGRTEGYVFCSPNGRRMDLKRFRSEFYTAVEAAGIKRDNDHKLTPYSCRHTFATLMKNIDAPAKDKLELMGHTSEEMLRHYQHVNYCDLRNVTDKL